MAIDEHLLHFLYYLAGALSLTMGLLTLSKKNRKQTLAFSLTTLLIAFWSFLYVLEIMASGLETKMGVVRFEYLAVATIPTLWLIFIIQFTGRGWWLNREVMALLLVEPTLTILFAWTNSIHHLLYAQTSIVRINDFYLLNATYGPWFWLHVAYSYLLMTGVGALIWDQYRNSGKTGKKQALLLMAASIVPWILNFIATQVMDVYFIDLTPFFLVIGSMIAMIAILRGEKLDIVPIARNRVIEEMSDAYLVLNNDLRILDANLAAEASIGRPKSDFINRSLPEIMPKNVRTKHLAGLSTPFRRIVHVNDVFYDLHAENIVRDDGSKAGFLATWRDVTDYIIQKQALENRVNQLNAINHIIGTINQAATLQEIYDVALEIIQEALHADKAAIFLFDSDGATQFVAWSVLSDKFREKMEGNSPWAPGAGDARPVLVEDVASSDEPAIAERKDILLQEEIRALGVTPIVHQERIQGGLVAGYESPHYFSQQEVELATSIAAHLAVAIEKARLLEQAQSRLRRIEALQKIDDAISSTLDLDHQIDILLSHVINNLQCDMSVMFLVDKQTGKILPAEVRGSYDSETQKNIAFDIGEGAAGWIVLHKKTLYIPYVSQDDRWKVTESSRIDQIVSYLGVPLIADGEVIGALDIVTRYFRKYTEEEIEFLQTLAGQAAIAIKNARLYRDLQKKVSHLEVLQEVSRELMTAQGIDMLLKKIVVKATSILDASDGIVYLHDRKRHLLAVAADNAGIAQDMAFGEGLAGRVALSRRPMIVDNYGKWEHRSHKYDEYMLTAVVAVPMLHGGELIGVLVVYETCENGRKFTEEDMRLLSLLASQAAAAVFNARLIESLHQRIQRSQVLYQISAELSRLNDTPELCHAVAKLLHDKLAYEYVYVVLVDKRTGERIIMDCLGKNCQRVGQRIPRGMGLIEIALNDRKLHYWPDVLLEENYYLTGSEIRSEIAAPIQSRKRLFGAIVVEDNKVDAFDQEDFDTLQTAANQLAVAMENAQRMEEISSQLQATTRLYQASQVLSNANAVQEAVQTAVRSLKNASAANAVIIQLAEEGRETTYGIDRYGAERTDLEGDELFHNASMLLSDINAITIIEQDQLPEILREQGLTRAVALPLKRGADIIGGILMIYTDDVHLSPQEIEIHAIYANQTTIAIEKAISMEKANRRALEQEVVSSIVRSLNETMSVRKSFAVLASGIRKLVAADRISIALPDEDQTRFVLSVIYDAGGGLLDGQWNPVAASAAIEDILQGKMHVTPDLAEERMFPLEKILYQAGYRSRINIPLKMRDDILGTLNIMSYDINEFTPEKLPSLLQIADALAISIANELSIKEERKRAQEIALLYSLSRRFSSLNVIADVLDVTAETIIDAIEDTIHPHIILASQRLRSYGVPRSRRGRHHAWVQDIAAYPVFSRTVSAEEGCFMVSRDDPTLTPEEQSLIFTQNGMIAWIIPLIQGDERLGVLVIERNRQKCTQSEMRLIKSIAELLLMTLHRVFLFHEVEGAYLNAVLSLALASDAKDAYTADHSQRLEEMTATVARAMGLSEQEIDDLRFGARLHDIGKIGVPDAVLKKPGPLTEEEWKLMREHPQIGENILSPLPWLRNAAKIVRHHHEAYNGQGYPDGLAGEDIPIGARILAVADAYGAITDRRVYKPMRSHLEAIEELKKNAGAQFDPNVVQVFLELFAESPPPGSGTSSQKDPAASTPSQNE